MIPDPYQERAKKIVAFMNRSHKSIHVLGFKEFIAAAIREAVEEERTRADENFASYERVKGKSSVCRAAAFEEAAQIAQNFKWPGDDDSEVTELIAHKIRTRAKEAI